MTTTDKLTQVHERAMRGFDATYDPQRDNRAQCLEDRRFAFVQGAQWEDNLGQQFENRPKFEVNKVSLAVTRLFSEYRNNRITVNFKCKDSSGSKETAETMNGLYRADEQDCNGQEAYDNAFEEAVAGGIGAWKIKAKYEDEEDEDDDRQRIVLEPIFDADQTVFFDVSAKRQDKADAKYAWHIISMTPDAYEERFSKSPSSFDVVEKNQYSFEWFSADVVNVAEYYEVEEVKQKIAFYKHFTAKDEVKLNESEEEAEELADQIRALEAQGYYRARTKTIKCRKVHLYVIDASGVLEDHGYIAGKYIPIIPMYGKRMFVDGIERAWGHVRIARDPQQIYNTITSALVEIAASGYKQKPIFTPEQIAGNENMWADDAVEDYPYLLINQTTDANGNKLPPAPIAYTQPPQLPQAMTALIQVAGVDIAELTGNQQNADQMVSNIATETVEKIHERLDMQAFIYMDNMAKAMRHSGCVWLSMAQELYDEDGREMRAVWHDDTEDTIVINQPTMKDNVLKYENNLSDGRYDVAVDVGASFASRREKTVSNLLKMLPVTPDPELQAVISATIVSNLDGEGLSDLAKFGRKKLLSMGAVEPTEEEIKEQQQQAEAMANQPPDAQTQLMQAMGEEAQANAVAARAKTAHTLAQADKANAETIKIMMEAQQQQNAQMAQILQMLSAMQGSQQQNQQQIAASVETNPTSMPQLPQGIQSPI
jgi:hypothetical protein